MSQFSHYQVNYDHQKPIIKGTIDDVPGQYVENLNNNMKVDIISLNESDIDFDLIGVDPSVANALRRILLAEVPTVAIEHVWIAVNNSVIQDEVLAHRVGLIPIHVDPRKLEYVVDAEETDKDTIVFHFDVECTHEYSGKIKADGEKEFVNENAYSSALTWLPQGNQAEIFPDGVRPVHEDILVARLKPGQRIEFEAHCRKGVGKDHTKFSPVATASYRLLPEIHFKEPVTGAHAVELKAMCPLQVFDIEDIGGQQTAVANRPRDCTMCRECIRTEGWSDRVDLRRKADHFIFSVESSGCMPPEQIVTEAISILKDKALKFQSYAKDYTDEAL